MSGKHLLPDRGVGRTAPAVALALLLATPLFVPPARAAADDDGTAVDDRPHITVLGTATADIAPDLAVLHVGVASENADAGAAVNAGAATLDAVIATAKAQGVAAADILREATSVIPVAMAGAEGAGTRSRGFSASLTIQVRCHDPARADALLAALLAKGVNRVNGIEYTLADPEPLVARLTGAAVANARRRAESAAGAAGVRLGPMLQIERPDNIETAASGTLRMSMPVLPRTYVAAVEVTFAIEP